MTDSVPVAEGSGRSSGYSIVIPAHNEGKTIGKSVGRFLEGLSGEVRDILREIIVVENGSTDNTREECGKLRGTYPTIVRALSVSRGSYGEAIKKGILEARGRYLSILECDNLDTGFVEESIRIFAVERPQLIVASKRHPRSIDDRPLTRRLLTFGFNLILRAAVGYPGTDTHGLKSMDAAWGRRVCAIAMTTDEIFQTELVVLSWRLGGRIVELPIRIEETRAAPVSVIRRFPKVIRLVPQLRRSIGRFPREHGQDVLAISCD